MAAAAKEAENPREGAARVVFPPSGMVDLRAHLQGARGGSPPAGTSAPVMIVRGGKNQRERRVLASHSLEDAGRAGSPQAPWASLNASASPLGGSPLPASPGTASPGDSLSSIQAEQERQRRIAGRAGTTLPSFALNKWMVLDTPAAAPMAEVMRAEAQQPRRSPPPLVAAQEEFFWEMDGVDALGDVPGDAATAPPKPASGSGRERRPRRQPDQKAKKDLLASGPNPGGKQGPQGKPTKDPSKRRAKRSNKSPASATAQA